MTAPKMKEEEGRIEEDTLYYEIPVALSFQAKNREEAMQTWNAIYNMLEARSPEAYSLRESVKGYPGEPELKALTFQDLDSSKSMWEEDGEGNQVHIEGEVGLDTSNINPFHIREKSEERTR